MAVTVKSNGMSVLEKLGVPSEDMDWIGASKYKVKLVANQLMFIDTSVPYSPGAVVGTVHVTISQLQLLANGTLHTQERKALLANVATVLTSLKKGAPVSISTPHVGDGTDGPVQGQAGGVSFTVTAPGGAKPSILDMLHKAQPAQPASNTIPAAPATGEWPIFPKSDMAAAKAVKLRDATAMYQPVIGTSANSRYFLVAARHDLKMAARWSGNQLSVRIEGTGFDKYLKEIQSAGFDKKGGGADYTSIHLSVQDAPMARKALGALIFGLGVQMHTPLPDVNIIHNA